LINKGKKTNLEDLVIAQKKLKEAGFPQEDEQGYISCGCNEVRCSGENKPVEVFDCGRERVYFPALSELIEACGDDFMLTNEACAYNDRWQAWQGSTNPHVMMGESGAIHQCSGSTPEEAVANLWLKINTK
jgi:hypothetical protein